VLVLALAALMWSEPPSSEAFRRQPADREAARMVLERHCGACHRSDLPTAQERALWFYDLLDLDWSVRMTEAQLEDARVRLEESRSSSAGEITRAERETFAAFVRAERARRQAAGRRPPAP
jgi:mono/diheme cytochrome c family protein